MFLPDMTPGARRALTASLAWTSALQQTEVRPTLVLLGLIHEEEGKPVQLLARQNVAIASVYRVLEIEPAELVMAEALPAPLDAYLQKLLYDARIHALEIAGTPTVGTEHLLLALVEDDVQLQGILAAIGFDAEQLHSHLLAALGPPLELDEPLQLSDTAEAHSIARILDANANRAREALRILEETARFHLNDRSLTRLAKELRHEITRAICQALPGSSLIRSRETAADVGTALTTKDEGFRPSLVAVIRANAQRLQEALRCLEEYGKVHSPELGREMERLRYRTYTLEKALLVGKDARERLAGMKLYLLASKSSCVASLEWTIREAAAGGVGLVQLREKDKSDRELLTIAKEVRQVTRDLDVLFIMNDRPDLARLAEADGVHLGQSDLSVTAARTVLGPDALLGVSTHDTTQLQQAILDGADYVGVGPIFPSQTKSFKQLAGLEYVRHVATTTTLPAFAIGGIDTRNVEQVVRAGLKRIAVGHAITTAEEPAAVARQFVAALR